MKKHANIAIFIPHKGCPNDCVFCNQKRISNTMRSPSFDEVEKILLNGIETLGEKSKNAQVAFFGGSFTGIDENEMIGYLSAAKKYIDKGLYNSVRISTRPDLINQSILDILKIYNVRTIELGVQSMDDNVLSVSKRGHTSRDVITASKLIKENGFELGHQMMVGLPQSKEEDIISTAEKLIALEPNQIRIYPVLVIKDTELCDMYQCGKYVPIVLSEAVRICAKLYTMFDEKKIEVIRIGLHSDEGLTESGIEAGPFHPAFGELVFNKIYLDKICAFLDNGKYTDEITVCVNSGEISKVIGNRKSNISYLKSAYKIKDIKIKADNKIKKGDFAIIF